MASWNRQRNLSLREGMGRLQESSRLGAMLMGWPTPWVNGSQAFFIFGLICSRRSLQRKTCSLPHRKELLLLASSYESRAFQRQSPICSATNLLTADLPLGSSPYGPGTNRIPGAQPPVVRPLRRVECPLRISFPTMYPCRQELDMLT